MVGSKWVWGAEKQHPEAIALVLKLSRDPDRETRNRALYFGLSTVRDKSEAVIRRLVEFALADHDPNQYGRVTWGLKNHGTDLARVEKVVDAFLDGSFADVRDAACVYFLYRDLFDREPPNAEAFAEAIARYPDDLFSITFDAAETLAPRTEATLRRAVEQGVPEDLSLARLETRQTGTGARGTAFVRGEADRERFVAMVEQNVNLRLGRVDLVSPQTQLFLEEMEATDGARR